VGQMLVAANELVGRMRWSLCSGVQQLYDTLVDVVSVLFLCACVPCSFFSCIPVPHYVPLSRCLAQYNDVQEQCFSCSPKRECTSMAPVDDIIRGEDM
jgi:hypothetical protein